MMADAVRVLAQFIAEWPKEISTGYSQIDIFTIDGFGKHNLYVLQSLYSKTATKFPPFYRQGRYFIFRKEFVRYCCGISNQ